MAVDKITFADKVSMIESTLPVINRIRDIDVNEIKDVVNNNADELETAQDNIETLQTKVEEITRYFSAWATSVTFNVPAGHNALVIASTSAVYLLWNPDDQLNNTAIYGSGVAFTRASDKTTITATRSGSATWTILVL